MTARITSASQHPGFLKSLAITGSEVLVNKPYGRLNFITHHADIKTYELRVQHWQSLFSLPVYLASIPHHNLRMASSSINLCDYPAAAPPKGSSSNFDNPVSLAATVLSVEITLTTLATLIVISRIYVNRTQLRIADCKFG